jgi:hypothetical protein
MGYLSAPHAVWPRRLSLGTRPHAMKCKANIGKTRRFLTDRPAVFTGDAHSFGLADLEMFLTYGVNVVFNEERTLNTLGFSIHGRRRPPVSCSSPRWLLLS